MATWHMINCKAYKDLCNITLKIHKPNRIITQQRDSLIHDKPLIVNLFI